MPKYIDRIEVYNSFKELVEENNYLDKEERKKVKEYKKSTTSK